VEGEEGKKERDHPSWQTSCVKASRWQQVHPSAMVDYSKWKNIEVRIISVPGFSGIFSKRLEIESRQPHVTFAPEIIVTRY